MFTGQKIASEIVLEKLGSYMLKTNSRPMSVIVHDIKIKMIKDLSIQMETLTLLE